MAWARALLFLVNRTAQTMMLCERCPYALYKREGDNASCFVLLITSILRDYIILISVLIL